MSPGAGLPTRLLQSLLRWRCRPALVDRALASLGSPRRPPPAAPLRVAAVQLRIRAYRSAGEFALHVGRWVADAADAGSRLVVFPEDTATGLLGLVPGFRRLAAAALAGKGPAGARPAELLAFVGPFIERVYRRTFSSLAARHGLTVVAGTALLPRGGQVYNVCHVFGPDGRLVLRQPKLHLFPYERDWGLAAGDDLAVCSTAVGRLAVAVCMDATYFETFRIARALGAEIVAVPSANPEAYKPWKALRGAWPRAQESQVYAVHSCLVGELLGFRLSGRSAVYAPIDLSPAGDGVLAAVPDPDGEGLAVADLDLDALAALRAAEPLAVPAAFCRRWFPRVYEGLEGDGGPGT